MSGKEKCKVSIPDWKSLLYITFHTDYKTLHSHEHSGVLLVACFLIVF